MTLAIKEGQKYTKEATRTMFLMPIVLDATQKTVEAR